MLIRHKHRVSSVLASVPSSSTTSPTVANQNVGRLFIVILKAINYTLLVTDSCKTLVAFRCHALLEDDQRRRRLPRRRLRL
jgi:hypothetical protein